MQLLFNDSLFPITGNIGFIETDVNTASQAYWRWQKPMKDSWGWEFEKFSVRGDLKLVLLQLVPLSDYHSRDIFVPTRSPHWTAFFGNATTHSDVVSPLSVLAEELKCRAIRVTAIPHTLRGKGRDAVGRYGGVALDIIDPKNAPETLHYLRVISAIQDGGRWSFDLHGQQQPFEEPEHYKLKKIKDRFTPELLDRYLKAMGIAAFDENFYMSEGSEAVLFVATDPKFADSKAFSLEEIQMQREGKVYFRP